MAPRYKLDTCPYCNGCGWANPAQAIDKCDFCAGSGCVTILDPQEETQQMKRRKTSPLANWHIPHLFEPNDENEWCGYCDMSRNHPDHTDRQHAPDGEKCWCGQYHPTDKDIGIDD